MKWLFYMVLTMAAICWLYLFEYIYISLKEKYKSK